jgi:hypothetical protein
MKVRMVNFENVVEFIKSLPRGVKIAGMRALSEYVIGDSSHGLKWYPRERPNQKYVRTFLFRNSWSAPETNSQWDRVKLANTAPYAKYVIWDNEQAWMHVGRWRTITRNVMDNIKGAIKHAQQEVNKILAKRK